MKENIYTTRQGQTWDMIAKEVYGSETYTGYLMQNNTDKLDIFLFSAGTELHIPDVPEKETDAGMLPDWRT